MLVSVQIIIENQRRNYVTSMAFSDDIDSDSSIELLYFLDAGGIS